MSEWFYKPLKYAQRRKSFPFLPDPLSLFHTHTEKYFTGKSTG